MYIGNRRTNRGIRAFRSPGDAVVIPKGAALHDIRTSTEPGYRLPIAMRIIARKNPSMYVFEYRGETLYIHSVHGLMEATIEIASE